jgi:hypothetical protein
MADDSTAQVASLAEHRERRDRYPRPEAPKIDPKDRRTARRGLAKARRALERTRLANEA